MTSNQLANAANVISANVLEETKRHNEATEKYNNESLALENRRTDLDANWKQREYELKVRIQDWQEKVYNTTGAELEQARTELSKAQAEYAGQEKMYLQNKSMIESELAAVEMMKADTDRAYKKATTELGRQQLFLDQKKLSNNQYQFENTLALNWANYNLNAYKEITNLGLQRQRINNEFTLGMMDYGLNAQKFNLSQTQWDTQKKYIEQQTKLLRTQRIQSWLPSFGDVGAGLRGLGSVLPFIMP